MTDKEISVNDVIVRKIRERLEIGRRKYGSENVLFNRNFTKESLEEILDCCVYISCAIIEYEQNIKEHNKDIYEGDISILSFDVVLINSDFDIKYKINRELLHRDILAKEMCSSYEPTIYPGVNMKYYYNTKYKAGGVCQCTKRCDGKGTGCGDGECKRVTIAIFNSGKIIITGGKTMEQLTISYNFINKN